MQKDGEHVVLFVWSRQLGEAGGQPGPAQARPDKAFSPAVDRVRQRTKDPAGVRL